MVTTLTRLPQPANPTIDHVCQEFLAEQRQRLKPRTVARYEEVLNLLRHHLNGYAYQSLSKAESSLFERCYAAEGEDHREFCQLFGPDKIVENLGGFFGYFMVRKVSDGENLKRAAGTVTKKLSRWLAANGYIDQQQAREVAGQATDAARDLPNAERATQILYDATRTLDVDPNDLADEDVRDFDHFTIAKIDAGTVWLDDCEGGEPRTYGPVPVPVAATKLLRQGWEIGCSLGCVRGHWRIIEIANVYPV